MVKVDGSRDVYVAKCASVVELPTTILSTRLCLVYVFFEYVYRDIIHESISDQLTSLLVLPHCLTIAVNNNYTSSTAYPLPQVRYSDVIAFMSIALLYSPGNGIKVLFVMIVIMQPGELICHIMRIMTSETEVDGMSFYVMFAGNSNLYLPGDNSPYVTNC